jgi:hypothetical protein
VKLPQHSQEGDMGARVVDDPFGAVLDEEFEQLQRLQLLEWRKGGGTGELPCISVSIPRPTSL